MDQAARSSEAGLRLRRWYPLHFEFAEKTRKNQIPVVLSMKKAQAMTQKNLGLPDAPEECSKSMGRSQVSSSSGVGGARNALQGPLSLAASGIEMRSRGKKVSMAMEIVCEVFRR